MNPMSLNVGQQGDKFLLVHHSCEPEDAKVLTRFKSDFYQVPNDSHPDNPRVRVRIPRLGESTEYGWRCGARDCEKCEKTAGTLTSLTIPVAISHGISGVPVQEQSGEILGILAVRGLRHRHATTFAQPKQAQDGGIRAPSFTAQRTYAPSQASTSIKGLPRLVASNDQQGSSQPLLRSVSTVAPSITAKRSPTASKPSDTRSTKMVAFAEDAEQSLFVSKGEEEFVLPTQKTPRAPKCKRSSSGGAIDREDGQSPVQTSCRPKSKAKEAATVSPREASREREVFDETQELDGEELTRPIKRLKESRAQRKAREQRELEMVMSWDRAEK
ncbi:hypothetical protein EJ03DRAFT_347839 [Teratosphaeria nubilosa]|uniref:Uncharacterized protein n=1 Tax=Teratosphaeria nubilosa TaxID=161662 RepID=A0A6G1LKD7_9PEZI|nr:hypothetical protein EJ03DRAFT_347839 [Teratosphaeria nubilosa]